MFVKKQTVIYDEIEKKVSHGQKIIFRSFCYEITKPLDDYNE